ncbi:MAG: IS1380 family transposase [Microthrixaceae bacterium]|nr:IS1380 family transposase [Geminicoccaceae bacterium]MCO5314530.1 IS1380 family transposase [Microthrixaceae bacterium]
MAEDALFLPGLSPVSGKPVHLAFDGGRLTSDGGVLVLAEIERGLGIAERLAGCITDPRAPERVRHGLAEMIRFRALLIAAGYPDANDCDALRDDPAFKMAVGRLPETGAGLCSQPTMCRLENLPGKTALIRMTDAMVDLFCDSFAEVPRRILLDIDDTLDRVHGAQQLSLFHAHHDNRCFLPIHIYEATTGKPVAVILRPGKTPDGAEVALVLRHLVEAIRRRWPKVEIVIRGDSHYARPEAMSWLERNSVRYIFGLAGNRVLLDRVAARAEDAAVRRAEQDADKIRSFHDFRYAARSWTVERRVIARIEATRQGSDTRFVVTNLTGTPRWLYEVLYCGRGQAENLIKAHKLHLASDRTSCSKATANQFRLLVHTAAYWLLHTLKGLAAKTSFWRDAQFDTVRLAFVKIAARVTELVTRIKVSLPSSYPYKQSLARFADRALAMPP